MTIENHLELIMKQNQMEEMGYSNQYGKALDLKHKVHQYKLYENLSELYKMIKDNRVMMS